ncbi:histidine phosphatase family protein [Vibrio fluminensis]|uniref:histidine phosphatase family protein n=1 Tax=Vibrio fluminensis TaxID=2783614 RepID=UPI0018891255|nr:phosphoglycerate mutase family protein [Vibrio fluminensis]
MGKNNIWVMRHGETVWNRQGRLQGQLDSELTASAKSALRKYELPKVTSLSILSSDLGRALETAKHLQSRVSCSRVTSSPLLRERHFGVLQGLLIEPSDTKNEQWRHYHSRYHQTGLQVTGCESDLDLRLRLERAKQWIITESKKSDAVLLVVHGEWWRAFDNLVSGRPIWDVGSGIISNGVLSQVITKNW